ncbi:MAG TPA: hypothetical protein VFC44_06745 [Candidatus Saccharimonadales bacterium]|nr:hypothetical protein [Candidatus Saccharimonadales bacterium]
MNKKMGRPRISESSPKNVLVGARFGKDEVAQIEEAAQLAGQHKSQWIRSTLLSSAIVRRPSPDAERWWGKLPYSRDELHGKKVEFKIMVAWEDNQSPQATIGTGTFFIREGKVGFHTQILVRYSPTREKVIDLTETMALEIKRQPLGSKCAFSLFLIQP